MAISETDRQETRKALHDALGYCIIAGEMLKAVFQMEPELWMETKRRGFPDVEKVGEMEGYIVDAMQRITRARKMTTVLKTKLFEIEGASHEQRNNAD